MCGNCGKTEHKYVDCPYIDMQFPPTKKEYAELKEKANKLDNLKGESLGFIKAFNWLQENEIEKIPSHPNNRENRKLRDLVEKKMDWASPYKDSQFMNGYLYRELRQILKDSKK